MPFNENHPNYKTFLDTVSEHRAPIVFWIGSGVSADAGLPNWSQLRSVLSEAALEEIVSLSKDAADDAEVRLDKANNTQNLWEAFEILKDILGEPTYKSIIRTALGPSDSIPVPELHNLIWKLKSTRGVVSLNIDGLEDRAHKMNRMSESVDSFFGRDLKNYLHVFRDKRTFIARLHGHYSDRPSWVFTKSELDRQISQEAYTTAVNSLFSSYTIVFLGISADDIAAGGFLHNMSASGLDAGNHFWITNRNDNETIKWSREAGLMRVVYKVDSGESHTSVIKDILEKAESNKSKEAQSEPVIYSGEMSPSIPDLRELRVMEEDDVRVRLNAHAKYLLEKGGNRTDTNSYQEFLDSFSPALHQASHLNIQQGYNKFFGYTAVERIHSGPFSSVWRVQDQDYKQYALKIMQLDNVRKSAQLDSFRRGITSQRLIRDSGRFSGIANIVSAYEIPPSVIMEFVEGESLEDICVKSNFDFWNEGLKIAINLCSEIEKAHQSKFGILHRDVRPTNIMIPNYYYMDTAVDYGLDQYSVKLLNYDMTWHKDASGRVVPINSASAGFYAPELINEPDSSRARDARVDSYGVGMTLFRISSGKVPPPSGSDSVEWSSNLSSVKKIRNIWFSSADLYLQRIIDDATKPDPKDRILVSDILARLKILQESVYGDVSVSPIEVLAENLMYALCSNLYDVSSDGSRFKRDLDGYRSYQIDARRNSNSVNILFSNLQVSGNDWTKIDKVWSQKLQAAKEILESGGWKSTENSSYNLREITLAASISLEDLRKDYGRSEDVLKRAIQRVQID